MAFWGLLRRGDAWKLTLRAWLILFFILLAGVATVVFSIYPFLSPNEPLNGELLIVEGWLPDYAIDEGVALWKSGKYHLCVTTGGPIEKGARFSSFQTEAEFVARQIAAFGIPESLIIVLPSPYVEKDRTRANAFAVRRWLDTHPGEYSTADLLSQGPHARRSWLLYERAFGSRCKIGIIAVEDRDYDQKHWWKYSAGVRSVIGESIAYLYAKCFQ
jgi:uncharacterized SAM-binding protein YcdF (DUF218 family)